MTLSDDRNDLVELMALYATMADTKAWELASSIFTDPFTWDFESASPGVAELSIATWCERVRMAFGGFDATHHAITNHRITVNGDHAHIRAHIHAEHWVPRDLVEPHMDDCWVVVGFYDDEAIRTSDEWRLARVKLTIRHQSGSHVARASLAEGRRIASVPT